ncbi:MAG: Ig-like domain repeat protein [Actinomycetota bacterium]|nr:MAG: Ig-like domain repeat protein [Actinomycetota bacterium]
MRAVARRVLSVGAVLGVVAAGVVVATPAWAANGTVSGCVVDKNNAPIAGLTIGVYQAIETLPPDPVHPNDLYQRIGINAVGSETMAGVANPTTGANGCFSAALPNGQYDFAYLDFVTRSTPRYGLSWYAGAAGGLASQGTATPTVLPRIDATAVTVSQNVAIQLGTAKLQDAVSLSGVLTGRLAGFPRDRGGVVLYTDVHKVVMNTGYYAFPDTGSNGQYTIGGVPGVDANGNPIQYRVRFVDRRHGWPTDFLYGPNGGVQTELSNDDGPFLGFDNHGTDYPFDDTWVAGVTPVTLPTGPLNFSLPGVPTQITAFTSSSTSPAAGGSVTLSATVVRTDQDWNNLSQSPPGRVGFYDGTTLLGTSALATGRATYTASLPSGAHSLSARYLGEVNATTLAYTRDEYAPSTNSNAVTVTWGGGSGTSASTTTLASNPTSLARGGSFTLTATVGKAAGTPTGTVTFSATAPGSTSSFSLGSAALNTSGVATLTVNSGTSPAGSYTVAASYGGDATTTGSTATPITVTLTNGTTTTAATTTTLAASATSVTSGTAVTFTATVASSGGTPTGTVTFRDGSTTIGAGTLSGGTATFTTSALAVGSHSITAAYGGTTGYAASTSAARTVTVTSGGGTTSASTTTLTATPASLPRGGSFTLTATVSRAAGGTATGTVTFTAVAPGGYTFTLGTAALNASGVATLTINSGTSPAGTYTQRAAYGGNSTTSASTSGGTVTVTLT